MAYLRQYMLMLAANLLIPAAVMLFMTGFFRPRMRTRSPVEDDIDETIPSRAPFDKVVFMVIDGLRRSGSSPDTPRGPTTLTCLLTATSCTPRIQDVLSHRGEHMLLYSQYGGP